MAARAQQSRAVAAELAKLGLDARGNALQPVKAQPRGRDLFEQQAGELAARRREQQRFQAFLKGQGLNPDGSARPAALTRGLEAAAGTAGLLALPAVAGETALDQFVQARQIDAALFLGAGAAREQKLRSLPFGLGRAYGYGEDARAALSGDLDARRASAEYRVTETERARLTGEYEARRDALQAQVQPLRNRAEAFRSLELDRRQSFDQTTVRGQQEYDRESRLLPARRAITAATRERAAAEKTVADALALQTKREAELGQARAEYEAAGQARRDAAGPPGDVDGNRLAPGAVARRAAAAGVFGLAGAFGAGLAGGGFSRAEYEAREAEANKAKQRPDDAQKLANQARDTTDAGEQAAAARSTLRQAEISQTRAELGQATERRDAAAAGARALGGLSRAGRAEAKVALVLVQRLGGDNVDPDTVALAESVAPEAVGKLKEAAGERAKEREGFRRLAPDEKRSADLGQARGRVNELEERERSQVQDDLKQAADDAAQGYTEVAKAVEDLLEAQTAPWTRSSGRCSWPPATPARTSGRPAAHPTRAASTAAAMPATKSASRDHTASASRPAVASTTAYSGRCRATRTSGSVTAQPTAAATTPPAAASSGPAPATASPAARTTPSAATPPATASRARPVARRSGRHPDGRRVDFHALRHTFITNVVAAGVDPKDAQLLARHSTITLTMDRYAHVGLRGQAAALGAGCPCRPTRLPETAAVPLRVTGTDGNRSDSGLGPYPILTPSSDGGTGKLRVIGGDEAGILPTPAGRECLEPRGLEGERGEVRDYTRQDLNLKPSAPEIQAQRGFASFPSGFRRLGLVQTPPNGTIRVGLVREKYGEPSSCRVPPRCGTAPTSAGG